MLVSRPEDVLPDEKHLYELILMYSFSLDEECELFLHIPGISSALYEGAMCGQLVQLFDKNKKLLLTSVSGYTVYLNVV